MIKAKSTHNFKVWIWSKKYYKKTQPNKNHEGFHGAVQNLKSGQRKFFHTAGELLRFLEAEYNKQEKLIK